MINHRVNQIKIKFVSLNITYIGTIFPHIVSSFIIYSQYSYNFSFDLKSIKLIIWLILNYFLILYYILEVIIAVSHQVKFGKQLTKYEYRENLFIFDTKKEGLHNYMVLITLLRDFLALIILLTFNIPTWIQIIFLLLMQIIYLILTYMINSYNDYKNILWFKIQEVINTFLLVWALLIYFTKFEILQFLFVIFYYFLLFISFVDLFIEIFTSIFLSLKDFCYFIYKKLTKKKNTQMIKKKNRWIKIKKN